MKDIKILYIEDDLLTAENVVEFLIDGEFKVIHTDTITDAIAFMKNHTFDIVLLDLNLYDYNGFEFLKSLKNLKYIPVIVISALSDTSTKVKAFRYGASDYMVKPIDLLELEARIWAVLGRFSDIRLDIVKELFYIRDKNIFMDETLLELTPIEYEIMELLIKNKNKILKRKNIISQISSLSSHRTLDYHIKNLRKKIDDNSKNPKYLKTIYGVGYKLVF